MIKDLQFVYLKNESIHRFEQDITLKNLDQFIKNQTYGANKRVLKSKYIPKQNGNIVEINSDKLVSIMNSEDYEDKVCYNFKTDQFSMRININLLKRIYCYSILTIGAGFVSLSTTTLFS